MKKILFSVIVGLLCTTIHAQIKVYSTGNIDLGESTNKLIVDRTGYGGQGIVMYPPQTGTCAMLGKSDKLYFALYSIHTYTTSDARLKENIREIPNALSIIKQLNGVQFDYKREVFNRTNLSLTVKETEMLDKSRKDYLGFLAQDVQKVLPQVVLYDDSSDIYSIDYTKIIPVLVEAIKEQQIKIDELTEMIYLNEVSKKSLLESASISNTDGLISYLAQNAPNPFSESTRIAYFLADKMQRAMINIYDLNGAQLKTISIIQTGSGSVTINASELKPGIYIYSLIADGVEVDTKRMILTE